MRLFKFLYNNCVVNMENIHITEELGMILDSDSDTHSSYSEIEESSFPSSDEDELTSVAKVTNFVEITVAGYTNEVFRQHFRLKRSTVEFVVDMVRDEYAIRSVPGGSSQININKAVLMTLWYMSNQQSFMQIADRFGVAKATAWRVINNIITCITKSSPSYIHWPNDDEKHQCATSFSHKGIERVIGAIGGTLIEISKPAEEQEQFCNRKGYHSIIMQAVVNSKKKFIDIFVGEPGSEHDARVFRKSGLFAAIEDNPNLIGDYVLLGDSAYPALPWLITPFRDTGRLTSEQIEFNENHSSTRVIVEHAFGLLKHRFRRIRKFENIRVNFVIKAVIVACVLHNLCIDQQDEFEYESEE